MQLLNKFFSYLTSSLTSLSQVSGLNGSGRSPAALDLDRVRADGILGDSLPTFHVHTVTVPGAAAAWCDTVERFGRLKLADCLAPAIKMAEEGYPVHSLASYHWGKGAGLLQGQKLNWIKNQDM